MNTDCIMCDVKSNNHTPEFLHLFLFDSQTLYEACFAYLPELPFGSQYWSIKVALTTFNMMTIQTFNLALRNTCDLCMLFTTSSLSHLIVSNNRSTSEPLYTVNDVPVSC